ncbi:MAG: hypothetical protein JRF54_00820 [Deltaproteobacteria bacterium]|nr:hypothetical protein [Deltaproteobacteria bacterium]MBW2402371.1 hypothetical protein [Deltaproteobacteria bacterium]MBW2546334.1 hypothetical protein [Deltaproteobacteria bacterium]MBW2717378.1 hypothetical protein [Deltaproteobacteria bacterium]
MGSLAFAFGAASGSPPVWDLHRLVAEANLLFMERAGGETDDVFAEPDGIVWKEVDPISGGLARWSCPRSSWMAFAEGTEPIERCEHHGLFRRWRNRRASSVE